jgi:hypothetical protein
MCREDENGKLIIPEAMSQQMKGVLGRFRGDTVSGFERYTKKTKRALFLEEMEQVVPWRELCALTEPYYPKAGNGRPPAGVERMLRIYFLQQWFNLSDPAWKRHCRTRC